MLKQVYEINELGYLQNIKVVEFDEQGNCLDELAKNIITTDIPQGLYKSKWTGTEWIETMTEAEYIATLPEQPEQEPTEVEKLRLEQAQANAEMIELMLSITNGGTE